MLVSIVIPCYNSEKTIGEVARLCREEFAKMKDYDFEMILVNDFSKDRTYEVIQSLAAEYPNIKGITLAKNFGQHAAVMAGLHYVSGDLVVCMDDDMQNHPSQIRQFLEKMEEGYDLVFGVYEEKKFGWYKRLTGDLSRKIISSLIDKPKGMRTSLSNFWMARRYVIDQVQQYEGEQVFVQILFYRVTHNIANISIEHYDREVGTSNYSLKKELQLFFSFMNYTALPLRLSTLLGCLFSALGFLAALALIINKILDPTITVGWSSLMSAMLILAGFLFLMLGIIGEYIGKIILNVNKMPQFVIRDTCNIEKGKISTGIEENAGGNA